MIESIAEYRPNGRRTLEFVCDVCGKPIEYLYDGSVVFEENEEGISKHHGKYWFAHKDGCHDHIERKYKTSSWWELYWFVDHIAAIKKEPRKVQNCSFLQHFKEIQQGTEIQIEV